MRGESCSHYVSGGSGTSGRSLMVCTRRLHVRLLQGSVVIEQLHSARKVKSSMHFVRISILSPGALAQIAPTAATTCGTSLIGWRWTEQLRSRPLPATCIICEIWRKESDIAILCICAGLDQRLTVADLDVATPPTSCYLNANNYVPCSGRSGQRNLDST
jgi:hypothetical protein